MVVATFNHPDAFSRRAALIRSLMGTLAVCALGQSVDARISGGAVGAEVFGGVVVLGADGTSACGHALCSFLTNPWHFVP